MSIVERRPLGRPSSARSSGWDGARAICRHRWPRSALIPLRVNRQVPDRDHGVRCCRLRGRRSPRGGAALRRQAPRGCRGRLQGAPGRQEAVLRGQGGPAPERGAGEAHWGCGGPPGLWAAPMGSLARSSRPTNAMRHVPGPQGAGSRVVATMAKKSGALGPRSSALEPAGHPHSPDLAAPGSPEAWAGCSGRWSLRRARSCAGTRR